MNMKMSPIIKIKSSSEPNTPKTIYRVVLGDFGATVVGSSVVVSFGGKSVPVVLPSLVENPSVLSMVVVVLLSLDVIDSCVLVSVEVSVALDVDSEGLSIKTVVVSSDVTVTVDSFVVVTVLS